MQESLGKTLEPGTGGASLPVTVKRGKGALSKHFVMHGRKLML